MMDSLEIIASCDLEFGYFCKAEDIYTAAGWESMYQNGYLHRSP